MGQNYFRPEIECASRDALHALQSYRLRTLVMNCYENLPFYREKMDAMGLTPGDIMTVEDIVKLPFTVKDDLRDNYPFGLFARKKGDLVRIHASSGTTGKPTVVGYTQNDLDVWADGAARAIVAAGGTKEDTVHVSYGYGLFTGGLGLHYGAEKLGSTAIPVSSGNTKRQIQILEDFGSDILCCTPSYAMLIGETCRDMGIDTSKLPLRAGIFGAEAWSEEMRRDLEKNLGIKAYDIYGLTEITGPGVSYECEEQTGMHVNEDHLSRNHQPRNRRGVAGRRIRRAGVHLHRQRGHAAHALPHTGYMQPDARHLRVRAHPCQDGTAAWPHRRYADYQGRQCLPVTNRACFAGAWHEPELSNCGHQGKQSRPHGGSGGNHPRNVLGRGAQA